MKSRIVGEDFSNQNCYRQDFSRRNLQYANFRNSSLIECKFNKSDLTYANFTGANCYAADFTDSVLDRANFMDANLQRSIMCPKTAFGITLTWKCETFQDMQIDPIWLKVWLFMPCLMKLPEADKGDKEWLDKLILLLGPKVYEKYKMVFANRII